jgi:hypothetical protein
MRISACLTACMLDLLKAGTESSLAKDGGVA